VLHDDLGRLGLQPAAGVRHDERGCAADHGSDQGESGDLAGAHRATVDGPGRPAVFT
jgi:hypothetical protein